MALESLDFNIISMEKTNGSYSARIEFKGAVYDYEITTNANMRYLDWIDTLSILDGCDRPFNGEMPYFEIKGGSDGSQKYEGDLRGAFMNFIANECSEKA